jgi:hypothetical protein
MMDLNQNISASVAELTGIPAQGNARFEPPLGKAFYGMGQVFDDPHRIQTQAGIDAVYTINKVRPNILSDYIGVSRPYAMDDLLNRVISINKNEEHGSVPVIAVAIISFNIDEYIQNFFKGSFDTIIRSYGARLKDYGQPVFVRPVYELNDGGTHGEYLKAKYPNPQAQAIAGYRRVVDKMKEGAGDDLTNVAWMWHILPIPGVDDNYYESWYPGNRYVDWIGVSLFSPSQITQGLDSVITFAKGKGCPIFIPESAPTVDIPAGVQGLDVIERFFKPYFGAIEQESNAIKGFIYINTGWDNAQTPDWPNAQIEHNPAVVELFANETAKPNFVIPSDTVRVGQKPYEGPGITAGWHSADKVLHIISKDKYWELNQSGASSLWTMATDIYNVAPFASAPAVNGLRPWEGDGITATWTVPSENHRYLRIISKNRFYRYDYQTGAWYNGPNPFTDPMNYWSKAPAINGLRPWEGEGITAVWAAPDNYLRIVSKNRLYRFNYAKQQWDFASAFPLADRNNAWNKAPLNNDVDRLKPWEGEGITAAWVKDGYLLQIKSRDKYWELDLRYPPIPWTTTHGNYRDLPMNSIWKAAPFVAIAQI